MLLKSYVKDHTVKQAEIPTLASFQGASSSTTSPVGGNFLTALNSDLQRTHIFELVQNKNEDTSKTGDISVYLRNNPQCLHFCLSSHKE